MYVFDKDIVMCSEFIKRFSKNSKLVVYIEDRFNSFFEFDFS